MPEISSRLAAALAGQYTIEQEIGAGGMAVVYLAHDVKHDRKVALKVLRPDLAATVGADRFLREVRIAANLTHPHILGLHDSGEVDGFLFYVMPFIDGESLRDRIAREGELPIPEGVRLLREIVDALGYAHAQGVVHRDIKPDNVLMSGRHVMVTDFGVAKAVSEATGRHQLTTAGVALGTPAYMSPEQASAEPNIDQRADIYAVGILAYELLTGRIPFSGTTPQQLLAAHLTEVPRPPRELRASLPPMLDQFVMKCLEKRPSDRWQHAEEMLPVLEALSTPSGGVTPAGTAPISAVGRARGSLRVPVITGVVVAMAVIGFLGWSSLRHDDGPSVTIADIRQVTRADDVERDPVISPDSREVAYVVKGEVFVRDLEGGRPISLTADRERRAMLPRWTEDGREVAFTESYVGMLVPRFGGLAQAQGFGFLWDFRAGMILSQVSDTLFVARVDARHDRRPVVVSAQPYSAVLSPDGRFVAFATGNRDDAGGGAGGRDDARGGNIGNVAPSTIWVADLESGEPIAVTDGNALNQSPAWLPDGRHLIFISNREGSRDLYVVALGRDGHPEGPAQRLSTGLDAHSVSVAADGTKAVYARLRLRRNIMAFPLATAHTMTETDGRVVTSGNVIVEGSDISADGRWIAFDANLEGSQDLFVMPAEGGEPRRITTDSTDEFQPTFSPDGREIVFHATRYGTRDLFIVSVDGGSAERLTDDPGDEMIPQMSRDGLHIAYGDGYAGERHVSVLSRATPTSPWGAPRQLSTGPDTWGAHWSPDRDILVAYTPSAIVTLDLDGNQHTLLNGADAGLRDMNWPTFSPDGRLVYFRASDATGIAIFVMPAGGGVPRPVFRYDPDVPVYTAALTVGDGVLYLPITELDSDIYVMDLEMR